jgi:hypothetical protein
MGTLSSDAESPDNAIRISQQLNGERGLCMSIYTQAYTSSVCGLRKHVNIYIRICVFLLAKVSRTAY